MFLYRLAVLIAVSALQASSDVLVLNQTRCVKCAVSYVWSPVCGSNLQTYMNEDELACAQERCFPELTKTHDGLCNLQSLQEAVSFYFNQVNQVNTPNPLPTTRPSTSTSDEPRISKLGCDHCVCPQSIVPVCGSDQNTYSHPCILRCKKKCKPELYMLHKGRCEAFPPLEATTLTKKSNSSYLELQQNVIVLKSLPTTAI